MKRCLSALLLLGFESLAIANPAAARHAGHPILGTWQWTREKTNCTEVYEYRTDGTVSIVSGAEVSQSSFRVSSHPDQNGFYELTSTTGSTNGARDCSDSSAGVRAKAYTVYVIFRQDEPMQLVCDRPAFVHCYGPLRRVEP